MRQIVLDTETTGIDPKQGHRVIEIGCVEMVKRRLTGNTFHQYLQPDREIDAGAIKVHGITNEDLKDKPRFGEIVDTFLTFVDGAELIIHNAPFDVGFLNHELRLLDPKLTAIGDRCQVLDTLEMARKRHPGQKNNLDALCKRYGVDNTKRDLHGALLDAEILADVYLAMTGGQSSLLRDETQNPVATAQGSTIRRVSSNRHALPVILPSTEELAAHQQKLDSLDKAVKGQCLWRSLESPAS